MLQRHGRQPTVSGATCRGRQNQPVGDRPEMAVKGFAIRSLPAFACLRSRSRRCTVASVAGLGPYLNFATRSACSRMTLASSVASVPVGSPL
jgi:hypothetical protein